MSLPTTGALSLNMIQTEFGGTNPIFMSEYYSGGLIVAGSVNGIPVSGMISCSNFRGKSKPFTQALIVVSTIGTSTVTTPNGATKYDVLVVAGGGAGGSSQRGSGGGGAGGVIYATNIATVGGTVFNVTIGDGGTVPTAVSTRGNSGGNSVFGSYTAIGGGGGGATNPTTAGGSGGSGGGVWHGGGTPGSGTSGQGYSGGATAYNSGLANGTFGATGGGGAGGAGGNASSTKGGNGGIGFLSAISGSNVYYAGGGGGSAQNMSGSITPGTGGTGGGGGGGASINGGGSKGSNASYYGGGGGGGAYDYGGTGYQGVVIVKFYT